MSLPKVADIQDLRSMRRVDLQKLAKKNGVKANMKNDDIILALEAIMNDGAQTQSDKLSSTATEEDAVEVHSKIAKKSVGRRKRGRPAKKATPTSSDASVLSSSLDEEHTSVEKSFDLFSVKPLWESSNNSTPLDSTPDLDSSAEANRSGRTRSSSRNRTPQMPSEKPDSSKTFSVDKARTVTKVKNVIADKSSATKRQAAMKRRSTSSGDVIQAKKSRRSKSANQESDVEDEPIDEELRKQIMDEIRKKTEANPKSSASQIPRFTAKGVTIGATKPVTPGSKDWNKLHHKAFNQLESIDDYERRKKKRAEMLLGSNQKNSVAISRLAQPLRRGSGPKIVKPIINKGRPKPTFMSPLVQRTSKVGFRSPLTDNKPRVSSSKISGRQKTPKSTSSNVFKPTITSTSKMNLNFGPKSSKLVTPKKVTIAPVPDKKEVKPKPVTVIEKNTPAKTLMLPEQRKTVTTPFAVNASITPSSTTKSAFDLKASLKKPISWVPHKGPLKPFNDTTKKPTFKERMMNIKKPAVGARDKRKQKLAAGKKEARDKRMLSRRGIK